MVPSLLSTCALAMLARIWDGQLPAAVACWGPMRILHPSCWLAFAVLGLSCDDGKSPPADLSRACQRILECRTEFSSAAELSSEQRACEQRLSDEYDDAASYGCASLYSDLVSCVATVGVSCDEVTQDSSAESKRAVPPNTQNCDERQAALRRCQGPHGVDDCVLFGGGGAGGAGPSGCRLSCTLFDASCEPAANGQSCACISGDKSGASFSVDSCDNIVLPAFDTCQ